jgi:hypothetical protein
MRRFFAALMLCAATLVFKPAALAQTTEILGGAPPYGPTHVGSNEMYDRLAFRPSYPAREPQVIKKGPLAPPTADRIAFTTFLKDKNTGLIRLLPRELFESEMNHGKKKSISSGGGAYYSFGHRTHAIGFGSDLGFDHNHLSVGFGGFDYGMMTSIGDPPLEEISLADMRTRAIAAYRPPRTQTAARDEYRRTKSTEGITFDGLPYHSRLPVQENSTYLLRSISYRGSDVLVAFRLVRKETDGSVIIAWKLLRQYPAPKLERIRRYVPNYQFPRN